jgi:hypothetical protein
MSSALDERLVLFFRKWLDALPSIPLEEVPDTMHDMLALITKEVDADERMRAMPFWQQAVEARHRSPLVFWTEHLYSAMLHCPVACAVVLYNAEQLPHEMHLRRVAYLYVARVLQ